MAQTYTYSITNDFPNDSVNASDLAEDIEDSSIASATLDYINVGISAADNCDIVFDVALSGADLTTLNGIVAAHLGDVPFVAELKSPGWDFIALDQDLGTPPVSPGMGDIYIVPVGAGGAWAGREKCLARWTGAMWAFERPQDGLTGWIKDEDVVCLYRADTDEWSKLAFVEHISSSTDNALVRWDGLTGGIVQDSGVILNDSNQISSATTLSYSSEYDNGTVNTSPYTIDWNNGQKQVITLGASITIQWTNPPGPCNVILRVVQDGVGNHDITWNTVQWAGGNAPSLTSSPASVDIVALYFNGTTYYGVASLNFL